MGRRGMHIRSWWKSQKERDHQEDVEVGGRILLQWILKKYDGLLWTGFIWLKIGTSDGILLTREWIFEFHKMLGISFIAETLQASQEELISMEFVGGYRAHVWMRRWY
jgi:hypothetical protein